MSVKLPVMPALVSEQVSEDLGALALDDDLPPLHIVKRGDWPRALCGAIVRDEFNPNRSDTAGRDRCPNCLSLARGSRIG